MRNGARRSNVPANLAKPSLNTDLGKSSRSQKKRPFKFAITFASRCTNSNRLCEPRTVQQSSPLLMSISHSKLKRDRSNKSKRGRKTHKDSNRSCRKKRKRKVDHKLIRNYRLGAKSQ
jgi:hypothetical protein